MTESKPSFMKLKAGKEDRLFAEPRERIDDFNFGHDTAVVFDDMLERSVPFYGEIQRHDGRARRRLLAEDDTSIYDLGCSTGTSSSPSSTSCARRPG